ncbi:hypothetical protein IMSAGC016_01688 [Muribaculaceae bacterium]|nr:hypothetical protein IMSAGC016_01688 [Muribaculaceae bacterium]
MALSHHARCILEILFVNLDVKLRSDSLFLKFPLKFRTQTCILLVYILIVERLVLAFQEFFENLIRKLKLTDSCGYCVARIDCETIIGIICKTCYKHFLECCAIFLFIMNLVSSEHHVKELLIVLSRLENDDLLDIKVEIALMVLNLALLDIEHGRHLCSVGIACSRRIESYNISDFLAHEELALILALEILGRDDTILYNHTTLFGFSVFIKLANHAFHKSSGVYCVAGFLFAETAGEHLILVINHFIRHFDSVVRHMEILVYMSVKLRSDTYFEFQSEISGIDVEIIVLLRNGIAQYMELVFLYIIEHRIADFLIDDIIFYGCAIFFLYKS